MSLFRRELARWEGLEEATGLIDYRKELNASDEHPRSKLHMIRFQLDFMGNGGSKWSQEKPEMEKMLGRVHDRGGAVRMLVLRPNCEECKQASRRRFEGDEKVLPQRIITSLIALADLRCRFPHLEIKLYEHAPFFRLTFIDKKTVIVGHYQEFWEDSAKTPLLVWEDPKTGSDWSFYTAFSRYFEDEWKKGYSLKTGELEDLAREYEIE